MAINKTVAGTYVAEFRDQNRRRIRKTFPTYKRASDYDKELLRRFPGGDFILPSKDIVKDNAEKWHARKKAVGTYRFQPSRTGGTHIDKYIVPLLGELPIQQVAVEAVNRPPRM
jgi:hypothetical protein